MNRKDVTPTQRYPKILWYQVKNTIPSEEQQRIILLNHTIRIDEFLKKRYPTASDEDIKEATDAQAKEATARECNQPTRLEKVVVNTHEECITMVKMIEKSENFIQWYER